MYSKIEKTEICCQNHKVRLINYLFISQKFPNYEMSTSLKYHTIQSFILGSSQKNKLSCYGPYSISNTKRITSLKLRVA